MPRPLTPRVVRGLLLLPVVGVLAGCSGAGATSKAPTTDRGMSRSERYIDRQTGASPAAPASDDARPPAIVDGRRVTLADLAPALLEAAGGAALEELILDRRLAEEAARRGVAITNADIDAERDLLIESIGAGAPGDADRAHRLLTELRRSRGLGPTRWQATLRRSALLRKLVADQVVVNPASIDQAFDLVYGERHRARLITTTTAQDANEAIRRLNAGAQFGAVAAEMSTDVSARRGGIIEPISLADTTYPAAIRSALERLRPGQISPPIAIDNGFAVIVLDEVTPAAKVSRDDVRAELERQARRRQERILMDQLGARLLTEADTTIFDPGLRSSWEARPAR